MTQKVYYYKGTKVKRPLSIVYRKSTYTPPTDEILKEAGYEIYEEEVVVVPTITYEERVIELIRLKYSINEELAILRQRDTKPEEFEEYNNYCEQCKTQAKKELGLVETEENTSGETENTVTE